MANSKVYSGPHIADVYNSTRTETAEGVGKWGSNNID